MMLLRTSEGVFQELVFKKHLFFLTSFQLSNSFSKKKTNISSFSKLQKKKVYTLTFILQYYYQSIFDDKNNFLVM